MGLFDQLAGIINERQQREIAQQRFMNEAIAITADTQVRASGMQPQNVSRTREDAPQDTIEAKVRAFIDDQEFNDPLAITQQFEGFEPELYQDTKDRTTIGYGFNIQSPHVRKRIPKDILSGERQMTREEAKPIFLDLYETAISDAQNYVGKDVFEGLSPTTRTVLTDMSYNLGADKLGKFVDMKKAILKGDVKGMAREMEDSDWFGQVGRRLKELKRMVLELDEL